MVENINEDNLVSDNEFEPFIFNFKNFKIEVNEYGIYFMRDASFGVHFDCRFITFDKLKSIQYKKLKKMFSSSEKINIHINSTIGNFIIEGVPLNTGTDLINAVNGFKEKAENYEVAVEDIKIYEGDTNRVYKTIGKIKARADSSLLSKTATMNDVNYRLKEIAIKHGANAITHVQYERSSATSWRGVKASGTIVFAEPNEKKCPFCAEKINIDAIACKHCGKGLTELHDNSNKKELAGTPLDEIKKAKELLDMGVITEDEFQKIRDNYLELIT